MSETKQAKTQWSNIFNSLKQNKTRSHTIILYLTKISLNTKGKRLYFPGKQKLNEFISSLPELQKKKKKKSVSVRKKIPEGNLDLHKGMKNTRNDMLINKKVFYSHFKSFQRYKSTYIGGDVNISLSIINISRTKKILGM